MNTKNNILAILKSRGFEKVTPTNQQLAAMNLSIRRFLKIVNNTGLPMTLDEASAFANWLGVTVDELTTN